MHSKDNVTIGFEGLFEFRPCTCNDTSREIRSIFSSSSLIPDYRLLQYVLDLARNFPVILHYADSVQPRFSDLSLTTSRRQSPELLRQLLKPLIQSLDSNWAFLGTINNETSVMIIHDDLVPKELQRIRSFNFPGLSYTMLTGILL